MRKSMAGVVAVVAVCLIAASCGMVFAADAKPIKVGQLIAMTGEAVEAGKYQRQGAELAVEKVNAAGGINGRKLVVVYEDDQNTNPGAVSALQKILEDKEIVFVVGPSRSTQVKALLPTINESKVPVAFGGTNYDLTHSGSEWVFRFRPHDGMSAKVMAKYLVEELGQKKIAIVHSSDAFGAGGRDALLPVFKELGAEVVFTPGLQQRGKRLHGSGAGTEKIRRHGSCHIHDDGNGPGCFSPGRSSSWAWM